MCARCHVGAEDRDMNHDIIAAGHPALYFDMAVYHERLPKHWRDDERSASQFRSQLWFAGQIAKLRAELELIEARATETLTVSCWPELSQYQCSSCHNQLDGQTPRLLSEAQVLTPVTLAGLGKAPTRLWNLGGWQVIDDALRKPGKTTSLEKSMVSLQDSLPDTRLSPVQIVERSREAIDRLDSVLHSVSSEQRVNEWTLDQHRQWTITQLRQALNDGEWEQATLGYVAAWALIPSFDSEEFRASLETMRSGLVFANRSQSPILPLKSDATFQKDKDLSTHAAPPKHAAQPKQVTQPKQAEWRSAVETVIALIDRSEP
jgi:hypothetical protein